MKLRPLGPTGWEKGRARGRSVLLSFALASCACHKPSGNDPVGPGLPSEQAASSHEVLVAASAPVLASVPIPPSGAMPAPVRLPASSPRKPRGIYAVVALDEPRAGDPPPDLPALVANPAVSGLAVRIFWSSLEPEKGRYDWSRLEQAFAAVAPANKTIQLIVLPGFGTPRWVLSEVPSCDGFIAGGSAPQGCGKATFEISEGVFRGENRELPLPWNPAYKAYWRAFLRELSAKYGPRGAFVSIAVAGPTAMSAEIQLPRRGDQLDRWGRLLSIAYRDSSYQRSNRAIVEEWEAAIDDYGSIFSGVTLVATRGAGLLPFTRGAGLTAHESVLAYFASHPVGNNAKATQTSGMKACRSTEQGIRGVKHMSADTSLSPRVLGGAQLDTSFSRSPAKEGCPASCDEATPSCAGISPDQALANVLSVYFDDTPLGPVYGSTRGGASLNYLQVYAEDIHYANSHPTALAKLEEVSKRLGGIAQ